MQFVFVVLCSMMYFYRANNSNAKNAQKWRQGLALSNRGIVSLNLLLHVLFTFFEPVALALDVDDSALMQHTVKNCRSNGHILRRNTVIGAEEKHRKSGSSTTTSATSPKRSRTSNGVEPVKSGFTPFFQPLGNCP